MKNIPIVFAAILSLNCSAQKQGNIWYFGNHAGLDFSTNIPAPITNGATYNAGAFGSEGTAVISDSTGSLLFYTNGQQIWNKNHQVMPHGDSLLGNISTTQSALIIAQPGSSRYFYVFTIDDFNNDNLKYGFRYSMVDICSSNGLGDVVVNQKNIKLLDTVAEKITAVRHANGVDYWIIVHKYFSDAFYSFRLSSAGIIDTMVSHIGSLHPTGMVGVGGAIGELKGSPDGNKLAVVNGQSSPNIAEYFNFDRNTGIVSNCVSIQTNSNYSYYGVSFSPDNSKLYISCWLNNNGVYQFDLNAGGGSASSVIASKTQITNLTCYAMQLAVNTKLYLVRAGNPNYLSVINNPNNLGLNCNYQDSAVYLNGKTCSEGLPNFIDSYDYSNAIYSCPSNIYELNKSTTVNVFPNPANDFLYADIANSEQKEIFIIDALGNEIQRKKTQLKNINFDTSNLTNGIYFIRIKSATGSYNKTFIVHH